MNDSYKKKYLKYKTKYLNSKKMVLIGGTNVPNEKLAVDEIYFWGRQFADHALFLHLLLEDENQILKTQAMKLNQKWMAFMKHNFEDIGIKIETFDVKTRQKVKVYLTDAEIETVINNKLNYQDLFSLLSELREFKIDIINKLSSGKWIGWVYPTFAQHILMELDAFSNRIQGIQSTDDDIKFYNKMSKDHTGFADNLTDYTSKNIDLKNILRDVFNKDPTLNGSEKEQYILLSIKYVSDIEKTAYDIQQKIHDGQFDSIIHPALIDHVVREQQRAGLKLSNLMNN